MHTRKLLAVTSVPVIAVLNPPGAGAIAGPEGPQAVECVCESRSVSKLCIMANHFVYNIAKSVGGLLGALADQAPGTVQPSPMELGSKVFREIAH
jgi:hypothetical protein